MKTKLTAVALDTLKEGTHWDTLSTGLHIRVGKRRKTWQMRFQLGGKYQFEILGYYPEVGLKEAREKAADITKRIEAGVPIVVAEAIHPKSAPSISNMIDRYESYRLAHPEMRNKSLPEAMRSVRHGFTKTGYMDAIARTFTKADLRKVRDTLLKDGGPYASNRFLAYLGPVMKWAACEDIIEHNITLEVLKGAGEKKRDRILSEDEIRKVWIAAGKMSAGVNQNYGRLVRFLLICAQRREEVATILLGDFEGNGWYFDKNKANREQKLILPRLAMEQIGAGDADHFAFSGRFGKIKGWSKLKKVLDDLSGVSDWTLHDLRRTAASGMQSLVEPHIIEAVLNHAIPGVAGVYMRDLMLPDKERALRLWAEKLERIIGIKRLQAVA